VLVSEEIAFALLESAYMVAPASVVFGLLVLAATVVPTHTDANGVPIEGSGIPATVGEALDMRQHLASEETITPAQMDTAVGASRDSFRRRTFGDSAADAATSAR
jgi:hypothetical protein